MQNNCRRFFSTRINTQAIAIFFSWVIASPGYCEDNLETVMARIKPTKVVAIDYHESRYISLMSDAWHGEGSFYALTPDTMIKEQRLPTKELMAIKGSYLYFYNQESGQKHQGELSGQDSLITQTTAFKGLINGDLNALSELYNIQFTVQPTGWFIKLTTKNAEPGQVIRIVMQGLPEQTANKLELITEDGDRTEYSLGLARSAEAIQPKAAKLLGLLGAN